MPFFSVVIPIYKVEDYLTQCVESVLGQSFTDWECILVDDGSPDRCGAICDAFAAGDSRVRVIHQQNGGVSAARNAGIRAASGEYVVFLDADDYWCNLDGLALIYRALEAQNFAPDELVFGVERIVVEEGQNKPLPVVRYGSDLNGMTAAWVTLQLLERNTLLTSVYEMTMKLSFLRANELYFTEGQPLAEDGRWVMDTIAANPSYWFLNETIYAARRGRPGSSAFRKDFSDLEKICTMLEAFWVRTYSDQETRKAVLGLGAYHYTLLCGLAAANDDPKKKPLLARLKCLTGFWAFDTCPKVRKAHRLYQVAGFSVTTRALGWYVKHR